MLSLSSSNWLSSNPTNVDRAIGLVAALKVETSLSDEMVPLSRELRFARRVLQYNEQRGKSKTTYIAVSGKPRYCKTSWAHETSEIKWRLTVIMTRRENKAVQMPLKIERMIICRIISLALLAVWSARTERFWEDYLRNCHNMSV